MLPLKRDTNGNILPIKNKNIERVCKPEELVFFFKHCFSPKEKKFKIILLTQLGCECRISEVVAINIKDFHKDSKFRKVDLLINKKANKINGKIKGSNVIVTKIIPEAIACHIRSWIKDNWDWILENEGYIFPSASCQKKSIYTPTNTVQRWFCKKRKQLALQFPNKGFDRVIGRRIYKKHWFGQYQDVVENLYLWSTHMLKRFSGTYAYLLTKDPKFVQELLVHEKLETTSKYYISGASVMANRSTESIKNELYDVNFYEQIKGENEEINAVWDFDKAKCR